MPSCSFEAGGAADLYPAGAGASACDDLRETVSRVATARQWYPDHLKPLAQLRAGWAGRGWQQRASAPLMPPPQRPPPPCAAVRARGRLDCRRHEGSSIARRHLPIWQCTEKSGGSTLHSNRLGLERLLGPSDQGGFESCKTVQNRAQHFLAQVLFLLFFLSVGSRCLVPSSRFQFKARHWPRIGERVLLCAPSLQLQVSLQFSTRDSAPLWVQWFSICSFCSVRRL